MSDIASHLPPCPGRYKRVLWNLHGRALALLWMATLCAGTGARAEAFPKGTEQKPLTPTLDPGDYVWKPEVSPSGPVAIIVSLPEQTLYVYRNGVRIGRSTISSGKPGHRTPTGTFTILEKHVTHYSSVYHNASMPYMERLTWGGVAIHAGGLPGYPESPGACMCRWISRVNSTR